MAGSSFGTLFRITTWGESHGPAIGVVVDGCPAGLPLCEEDIQRELDRRRPGQNAFSTPRRERDCVHIQSGIFQGKTTGCPISLEVLNENQRSGDYSQIASCYRPGHADFTFDQKYGFRDYRGGGRSSGRETIGRVAAGAIAKKLLACLEIELLAYSIQIGPIIATSFDAEEIERNPFRMADAKAASLVQHYVEQKMQEQDSVGGILECRASQVPPGLGEPVFHKLDADLAAAIMSIGAVKGVEIGDGFAAASSCGSQNNDGFRMEGGRPVKTSNHAGGILGGISDGSPILLRAAVKPTPSIARPQDTITQEGEAVSISIRGRHDPLVIPRASVVVEAMTALVLADHLLQNMSSRLDHVVHFYQPIAPEHQN